MGQTREQYDLCQRVLDAWDKGENAGEISATNDITRSRVSQIVCDARRRNDPRAHDRGGIAAGNRHIRNENILNAWSVGESVDEIAVKYSLSPKMVGYIVVSARQRGDERAALHKDEPELFPTRSSFKPLAPEFGIVAETRVMSYAVIGLGVMSAIPVSLPKIIMERSRWLDIDPDDDLSETVVSNVVDLAAYLPKAETREHAEIV